MSQRAPSEQNYGSAYSPSRTERPTAHEREEGVRGQVTERQLHGDSPSRHDVEFYVRKVNRYEVEISRLENDLSVAKFKLSKAEDYEIKYDLLFKENQKTITDYLDGRDELERARRELERTRADHDQALLNNRALRAELDAEKKASEEVRTKKEELRSQTTSQGQEEREALRESFTREVETLRQQNRDQQEKLKREVGELRSTIVLKETIEGALANKLEHIKREKNAEIDRLKTLVSGLREELGDTHAANEHRARASREELIGETEDRLGNVRRLGQLIEETLQEEVHNLNETLRKKNDEINFLTACDRRQLEDHENSENSLKLLVAKLEDKIFTIQRENELELYDTVSRLKSQYEENLTKAQAEWDDIRSAHNATVDALRREIAEQKKEIQLLGSENAALEGQHKQLAAEQQHSVQMLSQKIIAMETERDNELRNYTTSMKQIEDDAKAKLDDLHTAIQNKNTETDILQAQIALKNGEITHLLEEISRLRDTNRQKMRKLETTNASEQNALNNDISALKKQLLELKRNLHHSDNALSDAEAEHQLQSELLKQELQSQREANELLQARNGFLQEWCGELERDLKAERVSNVNILHDHNMSNRENVQLREEVRVELEAVKNKEVEQIRNVHKLEKNRLQSELAKREHELRDKKEELARLLVQFKALEAKVGKSSKLDRSAEDEGRCRATLEAEILLTENIYNAINRP